MSLRKATNVRVEQGGIIFIHHKIFFAKGRYFKFSDSEFEEVNKLRKGFGAAKIGNDKGRALWLTRDGYYWAELGLNSEEVDLLIWERKQKHKDKIDRLRRLRSGKKTISKSKRKVIPSNVKKTVWRRDGARCVQCASKEDLQFDHIIPVSKGGVSTLENLQVLCGLCNRRKSDSIA